MKNTEWQRMRTSSSLLFFISFIVALPVIAGEAAADGISQAIEQLASEEFETRASAQKQLQQAGLSVLPALRAACKKTSDAEVRARLQQVLQRIYAQHPAAALRITLELSTATLTMDERGTVEVTVYFENLTDAPLVVIRPRKDSIEGGRTPAYSFQFRKDGALVGEDAEGRGSVDVRALERKDPFEERHFVTLQPGQKERVASHTLQSKNLVMRDSNGKTKASMSGKYSLVLTYLVPEGIASSEVVLSSIREKGAVPLLEKAFKASVDSVPAEIELKRPAAEQKEQ